MSVEGSQRERRDFIRMKVGSSLPASVRGKAYEAEGVCLDLSGGGMQLILNREPVNGQEVEVTVATEKGPTPTLRAYTRVVHVEPDAEQPDQYRTGVEILEILD